jgi:hypothetical protein
VRPREKLDDRALAAEYIAQEVRDMGLTPDIVVKERQDTTIQNVVVTIPGRSRLDVGEDAGSHPFKEKQMRSLLLARTTMFKTASRRVGAEKRAGISSCW